MNEPINSTNPKMPWEAELWSPEALFDGRTVFCVACGPSLTPQIADALRGRPTVVVNSAVYLLPWADVLFFTDAGWFEAFNEGKEKARHRDLCGRHGNDVWPRRRFVEGFPGLVVTFAPLAKRVLDDPSNPYPMARRPRVCRVKAAAAPTPRQLGRAGYEWRFPGVGSSVVLGGRSSGHSAISLAIVMGAARVVLVGYDMRVVAGREHFHSDYQGGRDLTIYEKEFVPAFASWDEAARNTGVEILNATDGSAIKEFKFVRLKDML